MTKVEIATIADAEALSAFAESAFVHTFGTLYDPADLALFLSDWNPPARIRDEIADPAWTVGLIRGEAQAIVGYIKLGPLDFELPADQSVDHAVELHQLYVDHDVKGKGIAAALMDWGIAWARARASTVYLSVFTDNHRAQAFYRRRGFVDVGRNAFRVGNHIDEDRFFRLDL